MAIITLTSDWGIKDHYAGMVKGAILSKLPNAVIVDISHSIVPYHLNSASFVLTNTFASFPKNTIHIIDITSDASIEMPHVVVVYDGYYFIGTDNGIFSLIFNRVPEEIYEIEMMQDTDTFTFSAHDLFVKVAGHIAAGKPLNEIGPKRDSLTRRISLNPVTSEDLIKGHVIYIDSYENVFTNITREIFTQVGKQRKFSISFGASRYEVDTISQSYKDVSEGEILALFSSTGHLEIAVGMGNAAGLLGLNLDDSVRVEFR
jgi:hypothetical protein